MTITRYQPWGFLTQLQQDINRALDESGEKAETSSATADWAPAVDVLEHQDRFTLYVDVPGVEPDSIDITLENGVLTVAGQRERMLNTAAEGEANGKVRERIERPNGRFHRRFTLPETADADAVKAAGRNGVLEIEIPKRATSQPRKIEVTH